MLALARVVGQTATDLLAIYVGCGILVAVLVIGSALTAASIVWTRMVTAAIAVVVVRDLVRGRVLQTTGTFGNL